MENLLIWILVALSLAGLANAMVFTGLISGWISAESPLVTNVCRMDTGSCTKVVTSPFARLAGVPNSVVGLFWYLLVLAASGTWLVTGTMPYPAVMIALSALTVGVGVLLTLSLLFRLKVKCWFCFFGHATNLVIFLILLLGRQVMQGT